VLQPPPPHSHPASYNIYQSHREKKIKRDGREVTIFAVLVDSGEEVKQFRRQQKSVVFFICVVLWNTKAENHELEIIKRNAPCQIRRFKGGHKGVPKKEKALSPNLK
jgi:hypothetical protein